MTGWYSRVGGRDTLFSAASGGFLKPSQAQEEHFLARERPRRRGGLACYPPPVAWIRQTSDVEATGLIAKIFADARKRAGRVWNIVRLTSLNGRMTRAHLGLYQSVMLQDSELPRRVRETLAVVVSRANDCHY